MLHSKYVVTAAVVILVVTVVAVVIFVIYEIEFLREIIVAANRKQHKMFFSM